MTAAQSLLWAVIRGEDCGYCGAKRLQPCRSGGRVVKHHRERVFAANRTISKLGLADAAARARDGRSGNTSGDP